MSSQSPGGGLSMADLSKLMQQIDLQQVVKLSQKVDLGELMSMVASMDAGTLAKMKAFAAAKKAPPVLPEPDGDVYDFAALLTDEQRAVVAQVRQFMEETVEPRINAFWQRDETPRDLLIEGIKASGVMDAMFDARGRRRRDQLLLDGFLTMEVSRIDVSTSTFIGVHTGLAMWSIELCGSEAQKDEWLPAMKNWDQIGCFGLTEPKTGSGVAGGLRTTCKREGDTWVLNGEKKWIGNSTFADVAVIWARDLDDNQVKGFLVRCKENPGYAVEKIEGKTALRAVENGLITLTDCHVPESDRLQEANSFEDTAEVLAVTRIGVAWGAVGCAQGAYEKAVRYAQTRKQFGQPIAKFQLIQRLLAEMQANVVQMQAMCTRLAQLQLEGRMTDAQASLAKMACAKRCRETVAMARELFGGNGILLEHHVARYFADAEAIYSYEGTNEVNQLIVGRAATGFSAFV
ncbi:MAG: acyl-CoA dehydrogenase family protein [Bacteroidota bacterium]